MSNLLYVNNVFCWSWKETQFIVLSIDCVDKRKRCQTFASIKNYCTYQFGFMKKHCPKSCQFCERVRHDLYDIFPRNVQTFYVNHIYNMTESWDTNAYIYVCWISHNHLSCITNELSPSPLLASGDRLVGYRGCKKIPVGPLANWKLLGCCSKTRRELKIRRGLLWTGFGLFGNILKLFIKCFIYLLNRK